MFIFTIITVILAIVLAALFAPWLAPFDPYETTRRPFIPPRWSEGSVDFYCWRFGTEAMHKLSGANWETWRASLKAALLPNQGAASVGCARDESTTDVAERHDDRVASNDVRAIRRP